MYIYKGEKILVIKIKKNTSQFVDTVINIDTSKLNAMDSPHHAKDIWIIKGLKKEIILLPELLEDKDFLRMIDDSEVLEKKFAFTILKKGRYLIKVKQI